MEIAEENKKVFLLGDNVCVGEGGGGGGGGGGFGCTFTFPEQKKKFLCDISLWTSLVLWNHE